MMDDPNVAPFRLNFDRARDPYSARNALGIGAVDITTLISGVVVQKFTSNGTYTPTLGMKFCIIECIGGGGGGGGVAGTVSNIYSSSGGAGGGYSRARKTAAQVGASQAVTIGAGGNAGAAGANDGSAGSDTSVGSLCVAKGGGPGLKASSASATPRGGVGNSAGTGDVIAAGGVGGGGFFNNTANVIISAAGNGGNSAMGGGGRVGIVATGEVGQQYGGGGGGALSADASNFAGGNGAAGLVIITEFI